jgi:hypothetical protein
MTQIILNKYVYLPDMSNVFMNYQITPIMQC